MSATRARGGTRGESDDHDAQQRHRQHGDQIPVASESAGDERQHQRRKGGEREAAGDPLDDVAPPGSATGSQRIAGGRVGREPVGGHGSRGSRVA